MRKIQKEQVERFVLILKNAHSEIINSIKMDKRETALDVLEQCYQGVVKVGTFVEGIEGPSFITVRILEEYCEVIYNIHKQLALGEHIDIYNIKQELERKYIDIENSVNNDIKLKKEIIFLPYKVAMWDCLESVWKAAKDDPMCDTYVIPIPYFEKKSDGSFGKMIYEGNDYPDYVPIVDFRSYDINKRRPDVIYIHNPYDNNNSVTSVHPDYYSEKLYEMTDKLVYIPYFLAGRGVSEDLRVLPGTVYAHKVILSNKKEKEDYIAGFEKWIENKKLSGEYEIYMPNWREKFEVLGSTKYDKVLSTERCKENLLDKWIDKIYREDGTRRKVLFYNTTVKILLEKENILEKIEQTIDMVSKENDLVLWWRPHPLYETTIEVSRPELLEDYRKIVKRFINEERGIFDDTPDLNRAVAEADAYYGDNSSVVYLFKKVGKPIMIQNIDV